MQNSPGQVARFTSADDEQDEVNLENRILYDMNLNNHQCIYRLPEKDDSQYNINELEDKN